MTDTGQVPGEGHPDNAGMVDQQGIPAPVPLPPPLPAGYAFHDLVDNPAEAEDEGTYLGPGTSSHVLAPGDWLEMVGLAAGFHSFEIQHVNSFCCKAITAFYTPAGVTLAGPPVVLRGPRHVRHHMRHM